MSTPYEVPLSNGMLLTLDRATGGLQAVMRPYPTDKVLLDKHTPDPFYGVMSWSEVAVLVAWLSSQMDAYGPPATKEHT